PRQPHRRRVRDAERKAAGGGGSPGAAPEPVPAM
ncbi:MAG: hypothetical protein AVDCRST_MAG90-808, partial [uncultured Microvirga sp.]